MNIEYVLIVLGEPNSTFSEIIGKYFTKTKVLKKKIILIGNLKLISKQLKKLNYNLKLNLITDIKDAKKKFINMINVDLKQKKTYTKISNKSNYYIKKCFEISLKILNNNKTNCVLINGPVSKKTFLKKNYLKIKEYLSNKTS
mgnify:FL=1